MVSTGGEVMIIKHLSQSGNSKAIIIDKETLRAAGLDDTALFAVTVRPSGGLTIESIESTHTEVKKAAFRKTLKENYNLLKKLSKR